MSRPELYYWANSLTSDLGLDPADVDLFALEIESEWELRAARLEEYYAFEPELLRAEAQLELDDLVWLEEFFLQREEYERCSVLLGVQRSWRERFSI
jgi:hypothetical protein